MASHIFSSGEVVRLKSGGPKMTISQYIPASPSNVIQKVICMWFDDNNILHQEEFVQDQLQLVS